MSTFKLFENVSDQIGGEAALKLHAFFGGTTKALYVPVAAAKDHVIAKIIGQEAFENLVAAFAGQTLPIQPLHISPLRNAGRVWALSKNNVSRQTISGLLGISTHRVWQIKNQLAGGGFNTDAILVDADDEGADHA